MSGDEAYVSEYNKSIMTVVNESKHKDCLYNFSQYLMANSKSCSTVYNYVRYVRRFLDESKPVEELVLSDYINFLNKYQMKTSSYRINVYTALKWFSQFLLANNINTLNPMQFVHRPEMKESLKTITRREKKTISANQMKDIVNASDDNVRDNVICTLLTHTGMRCKGLWKLDVEDIDFENRMIITIDKGDKIQKYYLDDQTIALLHAWLSKRAKILNGKKESALFISPKTAVRISRKSISKVIQKYGNEIGMHVTPHMLRSGAITAVYNATKDIYVAQQFAGHNSAKTTELYIRDKDNNARKEGARIMSNIFSTN